MVCQNVNVGIPLPDGFKLTPGGTNCCLALGVNLYL